jgi:hypothetical protein
MKQSWPELHVRAIDGPGRREAAPRLGLEQLADDGGALLRDFFCLLLGRGFDGFVGRWAARIAPILHASLEESLACLALQSLLIGTERAGCDFLIRVDCKTRLRRQDCDQSGSQKCVTRHPVPPVAPNSASRRLDFE